MGKGIKQCLERKGADKIRDMNGGVHDRVGKEFEVQMWRDVSTNNQTAWGQWTGEEEASTVHKEKSGICKLSGLSPIKTPLKDGAKANQAYKLTDPRKHPTKMRKKSNKQMHFITGYFMLQNKSHRKKKKGSWGRERDPVSPQRTWTCLR